MNEKGAASRFEAIHPETRLESVTLRVASLERSAGLYRDILGLEILKSGGGGLVLGSGEALPLLRLKETPGARPMPRNASGLYHFAVLLPSRADLGRVLRRLIEAKIPFGQADHLVSEALYLSDPDGNGIEIYRDRPRSEWKWDGGVVRMAVDPLDLEELLAEGERDRLPSSGIPRETRIGHIHLQISSIEEGSAFYHKTLGFDVTSRLQGALFLSAGGYHHHIGLNTWASRGAPPAPSGSAGLESFTILVPHEEEQARLARRLAGAGIPTTRNDGRLTARDPWEMGIEIAVGRNMK
jgi:catechol 2,3-dioxygenase